MQLTLIRDQSNDRCTLGRLFINGSFLCYTLEDVDRRLESGGEKIHGQTAIPRGAYSIIINRSQRFGRDMPLLLDVPGFSGVRIHPGNTAADTEGCILVGTTRGAESLGNSRAAYEKLYDMIEHELRDVGLGQPSTVVLTVE